MTNVKMGYESPTITIFVVQTNGIICQSINGNAIDNATLDDWGTI